MGHGTRTKATKTGGLERSETVMRRQLFRMGMRLNTHLQRTLSSLGIRHLGLIIFEYVRTSRAPLASLTSPFSRRTHPCYGTYPTISS